MVYDGKGFGGRGYGGWGASERAKYSKAKGRPESLP